MGQGRETQGWVQSKTERKGDGRHAEARTDSEV